MYRQKKLKVVAPDLNLGLHSLRASGATTAANAPGVSDRCLKRHGRWKSGANFINKVRTIYLKLCVRCFLRSAYVSFIKTS